MRTPLIALSLIAALGLSACSGVVGGAPTPEPWTPPASPTAAAEPTAAAPGATATPGETAQPTAAPAASEATSTPAPVATYTVQRGDVVEMATVEGVVISSQRRDLSFAQGGTLTTLGVSGPGQVEKGQLLGELDMGELPAQLEEAQLAYTREKAAFDNVLRSLDLPVRRAEIDLASARDALEEARRPATPEELATARARVQSAQAALSRVRNDASAEKNRAQIALGTAQQNLLNAQKEYSAAALRVEESKDPTADQRLADANTALRAAEEEFARAQVALENARGNEIAAVQDAEAQVATAQAELDRLLKLPDPYAVKQAERAVQLAQLAVDEARARATPDPDQAARVDAAKKVVSEIEAQMDQRRIYAPFTGEVVAVTASVGARVEPNQTVITILDPSIDADQREVQFNPLDAQLASRLVAGLPVQVSFPGQTTPPIAGQIARVTGGDAGALPTVFVSYDAQATAAEAGAPALVAIELSRKSSVLWLPPEAIQNDGAPFVIVRDGGQDSRVNLELGISSPERVEVMGGIREGQVVVRLGS